MENLNYDINFVCEHRIWKIFKFVFFFFFKMISIRYDMNTAYGEPTILTCTMILFFHMNSVVGKCTILRLFIFYVNTEYGKRNVKL